MIGESCRVKIDYRMERGEMLLFGNCGEIEKEV